MVPLAKVMEVLPRPQQEPLELIAWEDEVRCIGDIGINKAARVLDKVTYTTIRNWVAEKDIQGIRLFE